MNESLPDSKYQKLACEYSKLRAQASVLKKAVLEEQAKEAALREQLRQKETCLRRTEQEVDSLSFRNKQLESRVAALQQELAKNELRKKTEKELHKRGFVSNMLSNEKTNSEHIKKESLILEELQKKVMENAQLSSQIDDKQRDLLLFTDRVADLEQKLNKHTNENAELEKRLRREIEVLQNKTSELETKLVEAASMLGSEDALSATGSDNTPIYNSQFLTTGNIASLSAEERIASLEKEVAHWRAHCEVAKLMQPVANNSNNDINKQFNTDCGCSTTAAGLFVEPSYENKRLHEVVIITTKEQLIYDRFCKKFEELLRLKCVAESRLNSFETEVVHLQNCLENATLELNAKDEQVASLNSTLQMFEEDFTTTRINYEEQISVLTEQVISLSDQLAASK